MQHAHAPPPLKLGFGNINIVLDTIRLYRIFKLFSALQSGKWAAEKVIQIPPKEVQNWALPVMPGKQHIPAKFDCYRTLSNVLIHHPYIVFRIGSLQSSFIQHITIWGEKSQSVRVRFFLFISKIKAKEKFEGKKWIN